MTLRLPPPLHLPAEPIALSIARRVRPARVIRTGADPFVTADGRLTTPITYTRDDLASAWYAELRAKQQAVR